MRFEVRTDVEGDEPYAVVHIDSGWVVGWFVDRKEADKVATAADSEAPEGFRGYWPPGALSASGIPIDIGRSSDAARPTSITGGRWKIRASDLAAGHRLMNADGQQSGPTDHPDRPANEAQGGADRARLDEPPATDEQSEPAVFHLPGQHDQRDHGRRLGGLDLDSSETAKRAARWHQDLGPVADMIRTIDSGQVGEPEKLSGGQFGTVEKVTFADGTVLVRKVPDPEAVEEVFGQGSEFTPARQCDAEQLAAAIGTAIGAPVPRVVRTEEDEVYIELAPGTPFAAFKSHPAVKAETLQQVEEEATETDGGKRLGLFDLLTDGWDRRNPGNWMLQDDGSPAGIDQSFAFPSPDLGSVMNGAYPPSREHVSQFSITYLWFDDAGAPESFDGSDLHPDDVAWLRARLEALENDFDVMDRMEWWDFAMDRLDALAAVAAGTTRRFGAE